MYLTKMVTGLALAMGVASLNNDSIKKNNKRTN